MRGLKSLVSLMFILLVGCTRPSVVVMAPEDTEQIKTQRGADGAFEEPEGETAKLWLLLEDKESGKTGDDNYWYSTGEATSRDQAYAKRRAYERAVANMAGVVPVMVDRGDLVKIIEKTDETVTRSGNFWTVVVEVRVDKSEVSALLGENAEARETLAEVAAGILTDSDSLYVYGCDTSADMQFALDKAKNAARVRLGEYLAGSSSFEREIKGGKILKYNLVRRERTWVAEVVLKVPVALNKPVALSE